MLQTDSDMIYSSRIENKLSRDQRDSLDWYEIQISDHYPYSCRL